jgi:hypothetical protein
VRIGRHGHRTHLGVGKLFFPSGFAAGRHGAIYVSDCSIAPATGMGPQLCPPAARWSASDSGRHDAAVPRPRGSQLRARPRSAPSWRGSRYGNWRRCGRPVIPGIAQVIIQPALDDHLGQLPEQAALAG